MLALVAAAGASLDAGSVGLVLARRWSESGDRVLFVDADASGSRLAERFGEAARADYSPAVRGLPSLIVAREPLTLRLLADHCYSLDTSDGSLWALFAPRHPAGARHAARWLAERAEDLMVVHRERNVILSAPLGAGGGSLLPLLRAVPVVIVLAPVESAEQAKGLWTVCRDAGLLGFARRQRLLIVEGSSPLGDDEIHAESGLRVAGRLPVIADDRVLRLQGGRKERAFAAALDKIAGRVSALLALDAAAGGPEAAAGAELGALEGLPARSAVNGAGAPAQRLPEPVADGAGAVPQRVPEPVADGAGKAPQRLPEPLSDVGREGRL